MAVRFEAPETRRRSASATRIYVPTRDSSAVVPDETADDALFAEATGDAQPDAVPDAADGASEEVLEEESLVADPETGEITVPVPKPGSKISAKAAKASKKGAAPLEKKPKRVRKPLFGKPPAAEADDGLTRPIPVRVKREMTTIERIGITFCAFVFAGMIVFILSGYERISRAYADINTLNDGIETVRLHISELNVQIECAVTIEQAQAAAEKLGMKYPTKDQYLSAGSPIPDMAANTGDAPTGEDPTADPDGNSGGDGAAAPQEPDGATPEA